MFDDLSPEDLDEDLFAGLDEAGGLAFDDDEALAFGDLLEEEAPPQRERGRFLGMTAQQRMILSIFLFLDVSVLGCMCLLALGAVVPPF
jgi:hypothetical protein